MKESNSILPSEGDFYTPYFEKERTNERYAEEDSNGLVLSGLANVVDPPEGGWQVGEWGKVSRS